MSKANSNDIVDITNDVYDLAERFAEQATSGDKDHDTHNALFDIAEKLDELATDYASDKWETEQVKNILNSSSGQATQVSNDKIRYANQDGTTYLITVKKEK